MVNLVDVGEYDLDRETLQKAVDTYISFRSSGEYQGNEKQEVVAELNDWLKEEGVSKGGVVSYFEKLRGEVADRPLRISNEELERLEAEAQDNPGILADDLNELYEGEGPLSDRIENFRRSQDAEPETIGILLATHNPNEYVLYNEDDFQDFVAYFTGVDGPSLDEMLVGERYELFREYCSVIKDDVLSEELVDATLLDAQDFVSTLIRYPECRYNFVLRHLFRYSKRMQRFEEDTSEHLDEIRNLPTAFLRDQSQHYEGRIKIGKIRHDVLDTMLDEEVVNLEEIIKEEDEKHEKDIMHSWDEFKVLAQIYYNYSKSRIQRYLEDLTDYLMSQIGGDELSSHIVTYQGSASFPNTRSWMVLYPSVFGDHKSAYQFFVAIKPDEVEFGLSNGEEVPPRRESVSFGSEEEISAQKIVETYDQKEDTFWEWNNELIREPDPDKYDRMDWFEDVAKHLRRKGQIIFHGAPGTGKTYGALNFSQWWIDEDTYEDENLEDAIEERLKMVTFHPTFSYEDFIEGITAKTENGNLIYEPESGVFKKICEKAKEAYDSAESRREAPRYILIIDEVNRGNIPKIFGETITLIENDKRLNEDNEMRDELPHSDDQLVVPPNLYIIGTMNTADRSIALVDSAIRRRFRFKSFPPNYEVLYDELGFDGEQEVRNKASIEGGQDLAALSILALEHINERIRESGNLGKGKQVGHSYLIGGSTDELLIEAWKNEILPLLEEYYFGDMDRLREHIFDGKGERLFDWDRKQIDDFDSDDLQESLSELVGVDNPEEE